MNLANRLRERWAALRGKPTLDAIIAHANPTSSLRERVDWAEDLFDWARAGELNIRLKWFLQSIERQPEVRTRVAQTLRSLVRDTEALDLFADAGLPQGAAFTHEFVSRILSRLLPGLPDSKNLADVFDRLFTRLSAPERIEKLDPEIAAGLVALFRSDGNGQEADKSPLRVDLEDALVQLADRICVTGSGREVRRRLSYARFRDLPFQKLPISIEALLQADRAGTPRAELVAELNSVRLLVDACERSLDEVVDQLEKTGVNTKLVYDLARLHAQLRRLDMLLEAWAIPEMDVARTLMLVADLVRQNHARKSVIELCRQNLQLLTRRIVERNAETGEHYVARDGREYAVMLRRAAGGGLLTGGTTLVKVLLGKLALAEFFQGVAFGLNYAISFVAIQLCGFTLATKQPATTAPALARRMEQLRTAAQLEALVDEVVFLIRSQFAAIVGNITFVVPSAFVVGWLFYFGFGHHLMDEPKALASVGAVHPLGGTWVFAIFTGVLLWLSSLMAAWADNWFVLHQLEPALAQHRKLQRWLGPTRSGRMARWLGHNVAGLTGNVALGLMLGLAPEIAQFFGLPLDVRHVTLASGQVTLAFVELGWDWFSQWSTLWTVVGILGIGAFNVLVSFSLALLVAIRARNVRGPELDQFLRALFTRLLSSPLSFLLPVGRAGCVRAELSH